MEKWIIGKTYEGLYYAGDIIPSIRWNEETQQNEYYIPSIWTYTRSLATRFNTKEDAEYMLTLVQAITIAPCKVYQIMVTYAI